MKFVFGTDGWRDIIADGFTFENVRVVSQAVCDYYRAKNSSPRIALGYDTRFLSDLFAENVALVAAGNGVQVTMSDSFVPTPALAYETYSGGYEGGIMITASHNPPKYNGFKVKASFGGSAPPEIAEGISRILEDNLGRKRGYEMLRREEAQERGLLRWENMIEKYRKHLVSLVDTDCISATSPRVCVDPMYGAAQGFLGSLLEEVGCRVEEINSEQNPIFGGVNPEPIAKNLSKLRFRVLSGGFDLGIAVDGDGDRVGAIDERGHFVNSHQIFALLLRHLVKNKGLDGSVVRTISTTSLIDLMAEAYGKKVLVTPVGFKYVAQHILKGGVLMGGEESGGIWVQGHIPERDGALMGCLLTELISCEGRGLAELLDDLRKEYGDSLYWREDVEVDEGRKREIQKELSFFDPGPRLGEKVKEISRIDGLKYIFQDYSWLMIRPSGTEHVVRIYAEASSEERLKNLMEVGLDFVRG